MNVTTETHPYRVGAVVYRCLADANRAVLSAIDLGYDPADLRIVDRRTDEVIA